MSSSKSHVGTLKEERGRVLRTSCIASVSEVLTAPAVPCLLHSPLLVFCRLNALFFHIHLTIDIISVPCYLVNRILEFSKKTCVCSFLSFFMTFSHFLQVEEVWQNPPYASVTFGDTSSSPPMGRGGKGENEKKGLALPPSGREGGAARRRVSRCSEQGMAKSPYSIVTASQ